LTCCLHDGSAKCKTQGVGVVAIEAIVADRSGGLAIALAEARPQFQVTLVDQPTVAPIAQRFVDRAGATDRVQVKAADIIRQPLTESFSMIPA
jgi:hypothetical protein